MPNSAGMHAVLGGGCKEATAGAEGASGQAVDVPDHGAVTGCRLRGRDAPEPVRLPPPRGGQRAEPDAAQHRGPRRHQVACSSHFHFLSHLLDEVLICLTVACNSLGYPFKGAWLDTKFPLECKDQVTC